MIQQILRQRILLSSGIRKVRISVRQDYVTEIHPTGVRHAGIWVTITTISQICYRYQTKCAFRISNKFAIFYDYI